VTVVDTHTHGLGLLPGPVRPLYRLVNRTTMPGDVGFEVLREAGVDVVVAKAVGDPIVTRWYRGGAWRAVLTQLDDLSAQMARAGGRIVTSPDAIRPPCAILGVEGADAIGDSVDRLDELFARGVRVVGLVHLADNQIGTTCMPWQKYVGKVLPVRRGTAEGLSSFGRDVVERMNRLGMVIDLAHADRRTVMDVVAASSAPVISSHTGARACSDFDRYLSDDEIRVIAGTGGVVGLWPYRHRGRGVASVGDLVAHARHVADLVGPEHLCIGTDMNGVPGVMDGYRDERDLPVLRQALLDGGFAAAEVTGIFGENFLRVWRSVLS
jgi:microsomal dipeptidase-like Zn-dependent dipeptidase